MADGLGIGFPWYWAVGQMGPVGFEVASVLVAEWEWLLPCR